MKPIQYPLKVKHHKKLKEKSENGNDGSAYEFLFKFLPPIKNPKNAGRVSSFLKVKAQRMEMRVRGKGRNRMLGMSEKSFIVGFLMPFATQKMGLYTRYEKPTSYINNPYMLE